MTAVRKRIVIRRPVPLGQRLGWAYEDAMSWVALTCKKHERSFERAMVGLAVLTVSVMTLRVAIHHLGS